ncbi:lactonase family protein [Microbacterium saccharophilum]|uniref:Lactonase family protein n=1 Tax=Microbacterium saccharophilum TaxID=1213358 RepID=A0A5C8I8W6_9MICO|nr:beta-propeller fold lactonase family protein [Microbacterium saccharophilum]TXK15130.1 lactonase family protein [Microbacterium saccharophilum]GEP47541.1 hypothetical protein MSA03_10490 [Microbacterium saccharophilum]
MRFFLGGYTADRDGHATGMGVLHAGTPHDVLAGGPLGTGPDAVTVGGSPSWIAWHPHGDVLYAALEGAGVVQAFRRTGVESFVRLGAAVTAGDAVCHVAVAPDGASLVASCWGDGRVVRIALAADGTPAAPEIAAAADDPCGSGAGAPEPGTGALGPVGGIDLAAAARALRDAAGAEFAHLVPFADAPDEPDQADVPGSAPEGRSSRAHQARFLPDNTLVTTDAGFDLVRFWSTAGGRLRERGRVVLPRGSGPRHTVWHPSGHLYVVTEHSLELLALAPDAAGAWRLVGGTPLSPAVSAGDAAAEVALSRDAQFVYAGVRGTDAIASVRVRDTGAAFTPVALAEAGVRGPRHHVVVRDTLLVAGQHSDEVASLTLDERIGVPGRVRHRTVAPSPSCILADAG